LPPFCVKFNAGIKLKCRSSAIKDITPAVKPTFVLEVTDILSFFALYEAKVVPAVKPREDFWGFGIIHQ